MKTLLAVSCSPYSGRGQASLALPEGLFDVPSDIRAKMAVFETCDAPPG